MTSAYSTSGEGVLPSPASFSVARTGGPRWDLAFFGILFYFVVEYSRLSALYPILQNFHVGKVAVAMAFLGYLFTPRSHKLAVARPIATDSAMILFLVATLLSTIFAHDTDRGIYVLTDMLRWGVIYLLVSRVLFTDWRLRIALFVVVLLNFKLAQFVVRMYFSDLAAGRSREHLSAFGVDAASVGYFANSGDLGLAMCVILPIAAYMFFSEKKKWMRLVLLVTLAGFFGAIVLCGSRGALVGAVAVALAAWLRSPRKFIAVFMTVFFAIGAWLVLPSENKDRFRSGMEYEEDATASARIRYWKTGLHMFADHPVFGVGPGNYARVRVSGYAHIEASQGYHVSYIASHSTYIDALTELGLVGTLAFLGVMGAFFWTNYRTRKELRARGRAGAKDLEYCLTFGMDLAMVGFLASGAFLSVLYYPHIWILLGFSAALQRASLRSEDGSVAEPAPRFPPALAPMRGTR